MLLKELKDRENKSIYFNIPFKLLSYFSKINKTIVKFWRSVYNSINYNNNQNVFILLLYAMYAQGPDEFFFRYIGTWKNSSGPCGCTCWISSIYHRRSWHGLTTPLFLTYCLQIYFQSNFFIFLLFNLFFLILTCSCQYSYNLMLTYRVDTCNLMLT